MLMGLIKAYLLLRFLQREKTESGGIPRITATEEDFLSAANIYCLLNGTAGRQTT
jgi:hypothetical protein